ncbi:alpha/beta hydrolase [Janibacter sp. DB-40]|uniref:alpha/beta hydrolase n=1 Tax=Janibacter sp. DB-40 TaxID=3028808 RepID=UPI002405D0BD|nr:alpha/beta hydrolase [Janibacter sp. DB-40]
MSRAQLPPTVSAEAAAAAAAADNRPHRWPLTPQVTRWLRTKGAAEQLVGFEADRAARGVHVTERPDGHLLMTAESGDLVADDAWVLWIHGGGFCWGSARDGTGLRLAEGLARPVISVEYPLAPEARFPVAIDVCVDAYLAGVAERGPRVLLGGVSAGANLALGVLQRLRARSAGGADVPLPLGLVALTPFGDLAGEGDSYRVNEGRDAWIRWRGQQERFARAYAGRADLRHPLVSPVHADWAGGALPPAFFSSGTRDLFLSDAARIHTGWRAAGGAAELDVAEGLWHSYHSNPRLPESQALMGRLLIWCEERLSRPRGPATAPTTDARP